MTAAATAYLDRREMEELNMAVAAAPGARRDRAAGSRMGQITGSVKTRQGQWLENGEAKKIGQELSPK